MAQTRRDKESTSSATINWEPRTRLGNMVISGQITNMSDALSTGLPVREPEIIDILLPDIEDEVIDVNMV